MWNDPVIEEIHKLRAEHAARFNYDLSAIVEDLKREEQKSGKKFVSLPPRQVIADIKAKPRATKARPMVSEQPLVLRDSASND
jgi:hypothetical protein